MPDPEPPAPAPEAPPAEPAPPEAAPKARTPGAATPFSTLLGLNLRSWLSARGFWMVVAAALIPLVLTGAWVLTHRDDVAAVSISWDRDPLLEGEPTNFTAVIANVGGGTVRGFNATVSVGRVVGERLVADATNTTRVEELAPGARTTVTVSWTPRPGLYVALADADSGDAVGEIEEFNNQKPAAVEVQYKPPNATAAPAAPGNLTGNATSGPVGDASLSDLAWEPASLKPGDNATLRVRVTNAGPDTLTDANLTLRVGSVFSGSLFASRETKENVTLAPGESRVVELRWENVPQGSYWVEAFVNVTDAARDPDAADNHAAQSFTINPKIPADFKFPEPPKKATIKQFYLDVLSLLHIRILLPFIGLFYAAGVLADEKERGNLVYILTRPVSRWVLPTTKFVSSFAVASVAVLAGIVATFFLLLGTPQGNVGFLTTPLLISLVALFVYGAFFILLGVLVERPYLVGAAFVIGWETIAGNFVPWVKNLTISHYLLNVIQAWRLDQGLQWLPEGAKAVADLRNIVLAGAAFLVAAAWLMKRREFDV